LGPLLFLLYINDLPDGIQSLIRLFADDSLVYRKLLSAEDPTILQEDLNYVVVWCSTWGMPLNLDKIEMMKITPKRNPTVTDYHVGGHVLSQTDTYKYLGLHISDDLNWNKHISAITSKANKMLYITQLSLGKAPSSVKEI